MLGFFSTAPKIRSDQFLKLERAGMIKEILAAVHNERNGKPQTGKIKVIPC